MPTTATRICEGKFLIGWDKVHEPPSFSDGLFGILPSKDMRLNLILTIGRVKEALKSCCKSKNTGAVRVRAFTFVSLDVADLTSLNESTFPRISFLTKEVFHNEFYHH
jgi:hypothetical protein